MPYRKVIKTDQDVIVAKDNLREAVRIAKKKHGQQDMQQGSFLDAFFNPDNTVKDVQPPKSPTTPKQVEFAAAQPLVEPAVEKIINTPPVTPVKELTPEEKALEMRKAVESLVSAQISIDALTNQFHTNRDDDDGESMSAAEMQTAHAMTKIKELFGIDFEIRETKVNFSIPLPDAPKAVEQVLEFLRKRYNEIQVQKIKTMKDMAFEKR